MKLAVGYLLCYEIQKLPREYNGSVDGATWGETSARLSADREVNFCAKHVLKHATTLHIYPYVAQEGSGGKEAREKKRELERNRLRTKNEQGESKEKRKKKK